jgi:hypothetical protein
VPCHYELTLYHIELVSGLSLPNLTLPAQLHSTYTINTLILITSVRLQASIIGMCYDVMFLCMCGDIHVCICLYVKIIHTIINLRGTPSTPQERSYSYSSCHGLTP